MNQRLAHSLFRPIFKIHRVIRSGLISLAPIMLVALTSTLIGQEFWAGASKTNINPTEFPVIRNGGFLEATTDTLDDPLHARSLVLRSGDEVVAFCVVDNCMIPMDLCDEAKNQITRATGILQDKILISATHCHSAPSVMDYCLGSRADPHYTKTLASKIADSIIDAYRNLQPAKAAWSAIDTLGETNCRRWITRPDTMLDDPFGEKTVRANMHPGHLNPKFVGPSGPADGQFTFLSVQSASGQPLALLANFSMHYFQGHAGLSSDYFGMFCERLKNELAPQRENFVAILSQGTSGDTWWGDYSRTPFTREIGEYTDHLVRLTVARLESMTYSQTVPLQMAEQRLTFNRRLPSPERYRWAKDRVAGFAGRRPVNHAEVYAEQAVFLQENPTEKVVLQALRVGQMGITAIPCEVYSLTGLKLKLQSPFAVTMNIELANGASGYIPPPEQHALGGYNTWPARTAGLEVYAETVITETVLELLESVAERPRMRYSEPLHLAAAHLWNLAPDALWRLGDLQGPVLQNAVSSGKPARIHGQVAYALPGLFHDKSPWTGRSLQLVGGYLEAPTPLPDSDFTQAFWFWNGMVANARGVTGILIDAPGMALILTGTSHETPGVLSANQVKGSTSLERNKWYQITWVRKSSKDQIFLNGTLEIESIPTAVRSGEARAMYLGGSPHQAESLEGKLDEWALFKRPLEAQEIQALYTSAGDFLNNLP